MRRTTTIGRKTSGADWYACLTGAKPKALGASIAIGENHYSQLTAFKQTQIVVVFAIQSRKPALDPSRKIGKAATQGSSSG